MYIAFFKDVLSPLIAKGIPGGKAYFKAEWCLELVGKGARSIYAQLYFLKVLEGELKYPFNAGQGFHILKFSFRGN